MTPSTPAPQPFFKDVIREIHTQNTCIQLLEQQRENMIQALLQANAQLIKAQERVQEADQWSCKIMGLVGQQ